MAHDAVQTVQPMTEAMQTMQEANKIIEDFSPAKYALYAFLFLVEIAVSFWIALKLI